jgi:hypothetical protein
MWLGSNATGAHVHVKLIMKLCLNITKPRRYGVHPAADAQVYALNYGGILYLDSLFL